MQETVAIRRQVLDDVVSHAALESPMECCGLLVGPADLAAAGGCRVTGNVRCRNVRASPTAYQIDPADHFAAIRDLRGSGRAVVGAYHSHPRSPAAPSDTDRREAFYPDFIWLIASLADEMPDIQAYRLSGGNFVPVRIVPVA
jgi:proteasome lid subunit RPN8/RPN11